MYNVMHVLQMYFTVHKNINTHTLAFSVAYLIFDVHPILICLVQLLHQQMAQKYCLILKMDCCCIFGFCWGSGRRGGATVVDSLCSGSDVAAKMNFGFLPICFTPSFLHLLFCIIMRKNFFVRMQNHSKDWLGAACTLAGLVASISGCFFDVGVSENGVSEKGVYFPLTNSSSITSRECKLAFIPWQTLGDTHVHIY